MKVLTIEDTLIYVEVMQIAVMQCGHTFTAATRGMDGIQLALETMPHLIFVDMRLPDMNGLAVARRLRQSLPATSIIGVTAVNDAGETNAMISAGCDKVVLKPFSVPQIMVMLEQMRIDL